MSVSPPLTIHEMRARTARELDASLAAGVVRLAGTPVLRDPLYTPDSADEARWADQRPARRIARGGSDL